MDAPLINGTLYEWSSIELKAAGDIVLGVSEISYSDKLEPKAEYGASAESIGATRGVYSAEGSITLFLTAADELIQKLGDGFKEKVFDVVVSYTEGGKTITDTLTGCRIKGNDQGNTQGSDATKRKFDLYVHKVLWNGKDSLANPLKGAAA